MSDDGDFDPRFDPAFQRGYDGVADATPKAPRPTPPAARAAEPEFAGEWPAALESRRADGVGQKDSDDAPGRRTNPFMIVLLAVSVLLIGGGVYLVTRMRDLFANTQSSTDFDFVTLQVLIGAAPIAIGLGVATGIGVLFIYAIKWDKAGR
jgi:hypothetical protein